MVALVLSTNSYNFVDRNSGENVAGSSVTFVTKQDFNGKSTYIVSKQNSSNMSEMASLFPVVPGIYDIEFEILPSVGNKMRTKISKSELLSDIDLGI